MSSTRIQSDIEHPLVQTQAELVPVAPMSDQHRFELNAINTFRIVSWLLIYLNYDKEKNYSYLNTNAPLIVFSAIVLIIKFFDYSKHRSKPLKKELEKNREADVYEISKNNPFGFTQSVSIDLKNLNKSSSKVDVIVGQETLYRHAIKLNTALKKAGIPFSLPSKFGFFRQILPHWQIDMVSKARVMEYFFLPGYIAGRSLGAAFSVSSPYIDGLAYTYSGVTWVMALRESYILNNHSLKLHLEGFSFKDSSWLGWPPTCIGMQLKRKILFYSYNSDFKATTKAIEKGEGLIKVSLANPDTPEATKVILRQIPLLVRPGERFNFFSSEDDVDLDQVEAQSSSASDALVPYNKQHRR